MVKILDAPILFSRSKKKKSFFREVQDGAFEQTLSLATLSVIETHGHLPFDGMMMLQIRSQTRSILTKHTKNKPLSAKWGIGLIQYIWNFGNFWGLFWESLNFWDFFGNSLDIFGDFWGILKLYGNFLWNSFKSQLVSYIFKVS